MRIHNPTLARLVYLAGSAVVCASVLGAVFFANFYVAVEYRRLDRKLPELDCRQALADELQAGNLCEADALLLGSSRLRMVQDLIVEDTAFANLSCPDLYPQEYAGWIDAWMRACGREPEFVVLALDFFGSSHHRPSVPDPPADYLARSRGLARKFGIDTVVSYQATRATIDIVLDPEQRAKVKVPGKKKWKARVRNWIRHRAKLASRRERPRTLEPLCRVTPWVTAPDESIGLTRIPRRYTHKSYYERAYKLYQFDPASLAALHRLKIDHPRLEFVTLVTPESTVLLSVLVAAGRFPEFETWLRAVVDEMGSVVSFMDPNSITSERANFRDENHLHPSVADAMVLRATGLDVIHDTLRVPKDFGAVLDARTIDGYLERWAEFIDAPRVRRGDHSKRRPSARVVEYARASTFRRTAGTAWNDCTWSIPRGETLDIHFDEVVIGESVEFSVDGNDRYALEFRLAGRLVAEVPNASNLAEPGQGLRVAEVDVPAAARASGFDTIRIRPTGGDGKYSLGHLIVSSSGE